MNNRRSVLKSLLVAPFAFLIKAKPVIDAQYCSGGNRHKSYFTYLALEMDREHLKELYRKNPEAEWPIDTRSCKVHENCRIHVYKSFEELHVTAQGDLVGVEFPGKL